MNRNSEKLKQDIESSLGRPIKTPKDFEYLRNLIYQRLGVLVSSTTLKRFWGYLPEKVNTRENTLDILSRFIGYKSWKAYKEQYPQTKEVESNPVMSRHLNVAREINLKERIVLMWNPDRICEIEYMGNLYFKVVDSQNTRLLPGDTFKCSIMVENEPLYIDELRQNDRPPMAYVCGKNSGIRFELKFKTIPE